jgi:hypothetical protein
MHDAAVHYFTYSSPMSNFTPTNRTRQTVVLSLPLEEVSAKVRVGPPVDDEEDYALPVWAGVVPIDTQLGAPVADGRVLPTVLPLAMARFSRTPKPSHS